jgi:son of sevenless-like protein
MFEIFIDKKVVQVRLKVCQVFLYWIQTHFEEDFADNNFLVLRLKDFIIKKVKFDFELMANQILEAIDKELEGALKFKVPISSNLEKPKPILGNPKSLSNLLTDSRAFLDVDPLEFARQLTLLEHDLYCKFQSYECLDQIWEAQLRKEYKGYAQPKPAIIKRHVSGSSNSDISILIRHTNDVRIIISTDCSLRFGLRRV